MKKTISMLTILLLTVGIVGAYGGSTITRTLPITASLEPFKVTLDIEINEGETYYAIDERFPMDWTILSASDGGYINSDINSVKWCVLQGAVDTTYEIEVQANEVGLVEVNEGFYMFERDTERRYIEGDSEIEFFVCETEADSDRNGDISMSEIMDYTTEWNKGEVDLADFMKAVSYWSAGIGC